MALAICHVLQKFHFARSNMMKPNFVAENTTNSGSSVWLRQVGSRGKFLPASLDIRATHCVGLVSISNELDTL